MQMSLLTELKWLVDIAGYKDAAPTALRLATEYEPYLDFEIPVHS
jgi:hypothetical protein